MDIGALQTIDHSIEDHKPRKKMSSRRSLPFGTLVRPLSSRYLQTLSIHAPRWIGTHRPAKTPLDFYPIKESREECIPPSSHHDRCRPPRELVSFSQFAVRCRVFNSHVMESKQATQLKINAIFAGRRTLCLPYMPTGREYCLLSHCRSLSLGCTVVIPFPL